MRTKPGWRSSEFWLVAACTAFAMWAGGYALLHPWAVDLDRLIMIIGAVSGVAGFYTQQRTSLKKDMSEDASRRP